VRSVNHVRSYRRVGRSRRKRKRSGLEAMYLKQSIEMRKKLQSSLERARLFLILFPPFFVVATFLLYYFLSLICFSCYSRNVHRPFSPKSDEEETPVENDGGGFRSLFSSFPSPSLSTIRFTSKSLSNHFSKLYCLSMIPHSSSCVVPSPLPLCHQTS